LRGGVTGYQGGWHAGHRCHGLTEKKGQKNE